MSETQRTFVMIKPDGVQKGLCGRVLSRFEDRGLKICAMKFMQIPLELAQQHYGEHVGKPFYEPLLEFITSGPVLAMVMEGEDAIAQCRKMMGATDPKKANPGTIRGDFGIFVSRNIIHGSDGPESAAREIGLFFREEELVNYTLDRNKWTYP